MTTDKLARLLELDAKRTQGGWHVWEKPTGEIVLHGDPDGEYDSDGTHTIDLTEYIAVVEGNSSREREEANAAFIAALANEAIPLLKEQQAKIEALEKENTELKWDGALNAAETRIAELTAENERLRGEKALMINTLKHYELARTKGTQP